MSILTGLALSAKTLLSLDECTLSLYFPGVRPSVTLIVLAFVLATE